MSTQLEGTYVSPTVRWMDLDELGSDGDKIILSYESEITRAKPHPLMLVLIINFTLRSSRQAACAVLLYCVAIMSAVAVSNAGSVTIA